MSQFFQSIDRYGSLISLSFKGHSKFRTSFGGVLTLCCYALIIAYLLFNLSEVWNRKFTMTVTTRVNNVSKNKNAINVNGSWDLAMQVIYAGPEEVIRENIDLYFTIYAQ